MESPAKKQKSEPTPFTEQNSTDDICLQFDDGKKLYVHPVFLFLMSPVFKAMFDHDCVEKKTNTITLKEKKYEDFLEFLMCLHPAHLRRVDNSNVIRIVRFASEYQVPSIESKCQFELECWLSEIVKSVKDLTNELVKVFTALKTCFVILNIAEELDYVDIKTKAIGTIARFGIGMYTYQQSMLTIIKYSRNSTDDWDALRTECREMFDVMSDSCKSMVFFARLKLLDKEQLIFD